MLTVLFDAFDLPYVQRAVAEIALLSVAAGVLGTWIVLRGLSFYAHAVGTAAFPGLVLADGLGSPALLGAAGTAVIVAGAVALLARRRHGEYGSLTAMALVGALAAGVLLASDVFHSQGNVERLLFGSLLLVDGTDQALAAAVAVAALLVGGVLGRRWMAAGFDAAGARALGARSVLPDLALLALIAAAAVAALDAIGALLATAMLVAPAATARLVCHRLGRWQAATAGLAFAQGVVGLGLSVELNAPPGATIAVVGGVVFALVALGRGLARRPRGATALAAGLLALVGAGCGSATGAGRPGAIQVVATTTQLGDIVREVGGRSVQVTQILRPNTDPHDYEPRPQDVAATAHAAVVVVSGDDLDTWMDEVIANAGGDPTVVDAGQGRPDTLPGKTGGPEASRSDPHWWHDPTNVEYAVHRIRAALVRAKPSVRSDVEAAAGAYERKVRALDTGVQTCLAAVPAADRKLVTDHDAFGYFAKRYGITVVGAVIPAQTTQAQPSAGEIAALGAVIRREHVKAVFPESSISPRLAEAIARETGASAAHTLYGDTLGSEGSSGATYLSMEEANADAMVRGFTDGRRGCSISGI